MYIFSLDIGSTNIKAIILEIKNDGKEEKINLIGKVRKKNTDFALFISELFDEYSIKKELVENIIVTGTGASFLDDTYEGIKIIKVDEFDAIGYGGLLLSNINEAIVVSIGTGTTVIRSNLYKNERLTGTGLGGGTFVGLSNAILQNRLVNDNVKTFNELIEMAKLGNRKNADLLIGDISKSVIGDMSFDITAANFAGTNKTFSENDLIASVANMIIENISLIVKGVNKELPVIYIGTFVSDEYIMNRFKELSEYIGNNVVFTNDAAFAISIGAWEYYLLKLRNEF